MTAWADAIVNFLGNNPTIAGLIVFVVSMGEALFVVGLLVPSTIVLLGAGSLVGLGKLHFWPVFLLTVLGAIIGDALSYWFGHVYKGRVKAMWPFSNYPGAIAKGEEFFKRHGGKSVFIGRFVPGVKAVVPGIAGMMGMGPWHFTIINVVSAFAWAAAHLFPAIVAGAALAVLGAMSTRLMVLAALLLILLLAALWSAAWLSGWLGVRLATLRTSLVNAAANRDGSAWSWIAKTFDPSHPHATSMLLSAVVLLIAIPALLLVVSELAPNEPMVLADAAISNFLTNLRNAVSDRTMIFVTMLGDTAVTLPVALATCGWLAWRRSWPAVAGLVIATLAAVIFVPVTKLAIHRIRPIELYAGADGFSFPSGHTTINMVVYGIVSYLIAQDLPKWGRFATYAVFASLIGLIALSRVYLGAHWPSDVAAGLLFGAAVAASFALFMGDRRHETGSAALGAVVMSTLIAASSINLWRNLDRALVSYSPKVEFVSIDSQAWRSGQWQNFPARRIDLVGETEEPLTLQVLATDRTIQLAPDSGGWSQAVPLSAASFAKVLSPQADLGQLPVLPTLQDGLWPVITLTKPDETARGKSRLVLRLWPTNRHAAAGGSTKRYFLGSIVRETIVSPWNSAAIPALDESYQPDIATLNSAMPKGTIVERAPVSGGSTVNIPVLLTELP